MAGGNWMNRQPGPKPGSTKAITQRKAVSEGYEADNVTRRTNMNQKQGKTGSVLAPGLTSKARKGI